MIDMKSVKENSRKKILVGICISLLAIVFCVFVYKGRAVEKDKEIKNEKSIKYNPDFSNDNAMLYKRIGVSKHCYH